MKVFKNLRGLDWSHIELTYVTHFYLNKDNAEEILSIFEDYAKLPADILDRVLFVLVDDGSPRSYEIKNWPLNMIVLRVTEDISWNNPGARNLGMTYAKSDKVFLTDIDHQLDEKSFETLLKWDRCGRTLWRVPRLDASGKKVRSHANTFLLSRGFFLKNFGYDEALCGHYACDDTFFVKYMKYHGARQGMIPWGAVAKIRGMKTQGYTHTLDRDKSHNKELVAKKIEEIKTYGATAGHGREFLNFEWKVERIMRRDVPPKGKKNFFWAFSWWGRWAMGEK